MTADKPEPMSLEECVTAFLELTMLHPEKPPKTQRADRDNTFTILGYNQAQEALRTILATPATAFRTHVTEDRTTAVSSSQARTRTRS